MKDEIDNQYEEYKEQNEENDIIHNVEEEERLNTSTEVEYKLYKNSKEPLKNINYKIQAQHNNDKAEIENDNAIIEDEIGNLNLENERNILEAKKLNISQNRKQNHEKDLKSQEMSYMFKNDNHGFKNENYENYHSTDFNPEISKISNDNLNQQVKETIKQYNTTHNKRASIKNKNEVSTDGNYPGSGNSVIIKHSLEKLENAENYFRELCYEIKKLSSLDIHAKYLEETEDELKVIDLYTKQNKALIKSLNKMNEVLDILVENSTKLVKKDSKNKLPPNNLHNSNSTHKTGFCKSKNAKIITEKTIQTTSKDSITSNKKFEEIYSKEYNRFESRYLMVSEPGYLDHLLSVTSHLNSEIAIFEQENKKVMLKQRQTDFMVEKQMKQPNNKLTDIEVLNTECTSIRQLSDKYLETVQKNQEKIKQNEERINELKDWNEKLEVLAKENYFMVGMNEQTNLKSVLSNQKKNKELKVAHEKKVEVLNRILVTNAKKYEADILRNEKKVISLEREKIGLLNNYKSQLPLANEKAGVVKRYHDIMEINVNNADIHHLLEGIVINTDNSINPFKKPKPLSGHIGKRNLNKIIIDDTKEKEIKRSSLSRESPKDGKLNRLNSDIKHLTKIKVMNEIKETDLSNNENKIELEIKKSEIGEEKNVVEKRIENKVVREENEVLVNEETQSKNIISSLPPINEIQQTKSPLNHIKGNKSYKPNFKINFGHSNNDNTKHTNDNLLQNETKDTQISLEPKNKENEANNHNIINIKQSVKSLVNEHKQNNLDTFVEIESERKVGTELQVPIKKESDILEVNVQENKSEKEEDIIMIGKQVNENVTHLEEEVSKVDDIPLFLRNNNNDINVLRILHTDSSPKISNKENKSVQNYNTNKHNLKPIFLQNNISNLSPKEHKLNIFNNVFNDDQNLITIPQQITKKDSEREREINNLFNDDYLKEDVYIPKRTILLEDKRKRNIIRDNSFINQSDLNVKIGNMNKKSDFDDLYDILI